MKHYGKGANMSHKLAITSENIYNNCLIVVCVVFFCVDNNFKNKRIWIIKRENA